MNDWECYDLRTPVGLTKSYGSWIPIWLLGALDSDRAYILQIIDEKF